MPIQQDKEQCMKMQDHLNGDVPIDTADYTDVSMPRKERKQEFLDNGFTVIAESTNSDLILVGKSKG